MYIKKVKINNIRSIDHFEMEFKEPAGWHVLIGDNGSGKSSVARAIALGLIGDEQVLGLGRKSDWTDWSNWLRKGEAEGEIQLEIQNDWRFDLLRSSGTPMGIKSERIKTNLANTYIIQFKKNKNYSTVDLLSNDNYNNGDRPSHWSWDTWAGWFSMAFGPNRTFKGEINDNSKYAQLNAHLALFEDCPTLVRSIDWLKQKRLEQLEGKNNHLDEIRKLINSTDYLPNNAKLDEVTSEGIFFIDGNGKKIPINELSEGYMSMIGLIFELLYQLFLRYRPSNFFFNIPAETTSIGDLPGIVILDEIDAHLHPTWQTRIGQWFTKYFPNIQFIVTTHSPLICRACEKGSIWRLAAPGSEMKSGEVTGVDREKLIFGNILDAYGTEVFGKSPVRSIQSNEKLERLGKLSMLSALGKISNDEEQERLHLQKILSTDDPTGI